MKNRTLVLVALCIALNMGLGQIASTLKLPIFMDSIGTVLSAILMGPWIGMLTGLCTNLIWGLLTGPVAAAFAPVAMVIGFVAGMLARKGMFRSPLFVIISGVIVTVFVTLVATPIRTYLFAGVTGSGADFLVAYLNAVGRNLLQSVAITVIWTNLVDKIVACFVAWLLVKQLPERIKSFFPGASDVA
ncbi:MAG: ECF transporter S component [Aminobacteriaceae bacterium]